MRYQIPRCVVALVGILASSSLVQAEIINFVSGTPAAATMTVVVASSTLVASDTTSKTPAYYEYKDLVATRDDMAATLSEMTGVTFTTGTYSRTNGPGPNTIAIGKASDLGLTAVFSGTTPKDAERYIVATANSGSNRNLVFAGVTTNGAIGGVYRLLEELGCRWYYTTDKWQKIPSIPNLSWTTPAVLTGSNYDSKSVKIAGSNVTMSIYRDEQPDFIARTFALSYYGDHGGNYPWGEWMKEWNEFSAWSRRNRAVDGVVIRYHHSYDAIRIWAEDQTSTDPTTNPPYSRWKNEYYAKIDGSRISGTRTVQTNFQFCTGNPEVVDLCIDYAADWFATRPYEASVSMEPQDGMFWCDETCEVCAAAYPVADYPNGPTHSDYTMRVANAVAETVPDGKYVGILAYSTHCILPTPQPGSDGVNDKIYASIVTGFLVAGKTMDQLVVEWSAATPNVGVYDYFSYPLYDQCGLPNLSDGSDLHYIATEFPAWHASDMDHFFAQTSLSNSIIGLGHYIASKILWDTTVDTVALRDEFIADMFGDAAEPMGEFFKRIDKGNKYRMSEDLRARLWGFLDAAYTENSNNANDPAVEERIDEYAYWLKYCEMRLDWEVVTRNSGTLADDDDDTTFTDNNKADRQDRAEQILRFIWQIKDTSMVDSLAAWRMKPFWLDDHTNRTGMDAAQLEKLEREKDFFDWPLNRVPWYQVYMGKDSNNNNIYMDFTATTGTSNRYEVDWETPEDNSANPQRCEESHPWKDNPPLTHADALTFVSQGIANNQMLQEEARSFGTEMVVSGFPAKTGGFRGNFNGHVKIEWAYYMFTDTIGNTPTIKLTAGKVGTLSKGDLYYSLYTADGETAIHDAAGNDAGGMIPNTGTSGFVTTGTVTFLKANYPELQPNTTYLLKCTDGGSQSAMSWDAGQKISLTANIDYGLNKIGGASHWYFYVPKHTKYVEFYGYKQNGGYIVSSTTSGTWSGTWALGGGGTGQVVTATVPPGADDKVWDMKTASGDQLLFLNVPGQLAASPHELLIPKDAIDYLVPSNGTSGTARGGIGGYLMSATHTYHIYTSSATLPAVTVTSYGSFGDPNDAWTLYSGTDVIASGTVAVGAIDAELFASVSTVTASNAYRLVYENNNSAGAELMWAAGQKICVEATPKSPYSQELGSGGVKYFFVPKGTLTINYSAESIPFGFSFYKGGVLKHTQAPSAEPVNVTIPLVNGDDDQFWKMGSQFDAVKFRFTNIPGHLGLRPDEVLVPRWTELD